VARFLSPKVPFGRESFFPLRLSWPTSMNFHGSFPFSGLTSRKTGVFSPLYFQHPAFFFLRSVSFVLLTYFSFIFPIFRSLRDQPNRESSFLPLEPLPFIGPFSWIMIFSFLCPPYPPTFVFGFPNSFVPVAPLLLKAPQIFFSLFFSFFSGKNIVQTFLLFHPPSAGRGVKAFSPLHARCSFFQTFCIGKLP